MSSLKSASERSGFPLTCDERSIELETAATSFLRDSSLQLSHLALDAQLLELRVMLDTALALEERILHVVDGVPEAAGDAVPGDDDPVLCFCGAEKTTKSTTKSGGVDVELEVGALRRHKRKGHGTAPVEERLHSCFCF